MTKKDKELLFKDLCARLPYGVKCCVYNSEQNQKYYGREKFDITLNVDNICDFLGQNGALEYIDIKPYLRPMSSMTKKEQNEFACIIKKNYDDYTYRKCYYDEDGLHFGPDTRGVAMPDNVIDAIVTFYNKYHFDYRGLIEKGLALEAPEGMYKF